MLNDLPARNDWICQHSIQRPWRKWQNDRSCLLRELLLSLIRFHNTHTHTHTHRIIRSNGTSLRYIFLCSPNCSIISPSGKRTQLKIRNQKISKAGWNHMCVCVHMCEQFCSRVAAGRHGSTVSPWANRQHGLIRFRHTSKNKQLERKHLHPIPRTSIHTKQA